MKEFNWSEFKDTNNIIAVHCKTKEEAEDFCKKMHEQGMKWNDGKTYLGHTNFDSYFDQMCYCGDGKYSRLKYAKEKGYIILEWSDYMQKEFTKADLKDGMVVEYKDGRRRLVVAGMLIGKDGFLTLDSFQENLESVNFIVEHTIAKVYKVEEARAFNCILEDYNLDLIWERTEIKRMTAEEMRQKLEELTGEKIEVEPSRNEMIGEINAYCYGRACSICCISKECNSNCRSCSRLEDSKLKQCYEKVMENGRKES